MVKSIGPDTRLRDVVTVVAPKDVPVHIQRLAVKLRTLLAQVDKKVPRSNENAAVVNLGKEAGVQLERLARAYPQIETVAWCTRNLFELNVILRHVLASETHLAQWLGQAAGDEVQIIEGVLSLSADPHHPSIGILKYRLSEIDAICARHGIDPSRPFNIKDLAKATGQIDDYVGLYKLFSKYVHPSSWLVNANRKERDNDDSLNVFVVHAQLYSGDTFERIRLWADQKT